MVHRNYHEVAGETPRACGRELGRLFGPVVRDYIMEERDSKAWQRRRRDAEVLWSCTLKHFPAYAEELQAYADAARLPLLDLWTMSIEDELDDDESEKCTTVVTNGGRLIAHNEDWDADAADDICILKKTCGSVTTLELYYYGCPLGGTALTICSRGYVQAINSLSHSDWQPGIPKIVLARAVSELSDADAELGRLLAVPRSSGFAHNLIHRSGRLTVVECTATRHVVDRPPTPFVHTNHMLHPDLARLAGDPDGKSTFRRYDTACSLVRASMDEASLMRLTGDTARGRTDSVLNRNTIARAIVDLDRRVVKFWLRREDRQGWVDYPIDFLVDAAAPSA
ncbi:MAG: C45 family peptidase [Hyphomonadaceae bacterium]|jgi:hypothetical protein|nr:C45 family peptidase [Hyphomonadaceae bacterium]